MIVVGIANRLINALGYLNIYFSLKNRLDETRIFVRKIEIYRWTLSFLGVKLLVYTNKTSSYLFWPAKRMKFLPNTQVALHFVKLKKNLFLNHNFFLPFSTSSSDFAFEISFAWLWNENLHIECIIRKRCFLHLSRVRNEMKRSEVK